MESIRRNQMITADLPVHVSFPGIWQSFTSICAERRNKIDNFSPYECQICWINIFAITSQNNHNKTAHMFFLKSQSPLKISNERLVRIALGFFASLMLFFGYEKCFCILIFHILMLIQNKWCIGRRKGKTLNSNAYKFLQPAINSVTCSFVIEKLKPPKKYSPGQVLLTVLKKKQGGILIRKFWLLKVYLHTTLIKFFFSLAWFRFYKEVLDA